MPQPTFALSGGRAVARFGNLPQPNGQGTLAFVDLNDLVAWHLQDDYSVDIVQQLTLGQIAWQGLSAYLASDFAPTTAALSMEYREASGPLGAAVAPLLAAGEQWLTFDLTTGILARFAAVAGRRTVIRFGTRRWKFSLEFTCREPFFRDMTPTAIGAQTLLSGSATNFNVTYPGSVYTRPIWTLTIPGGNAVAIASFRLQNTMSGDDLTVTFPSPLPASTAAVVTIDSSAMTVTDGNGVAYDVSGTAFPLLYPPAGTVQQIRGTLTPVSGTATGCTIGATYTPRWLI